ncbi:hypothetical protein MTR67_004614, partial [Solanum verrucosum]
NIILNFEDKFFLLGCLKSSSFQRALYKWWNSSSPTRWHPVRRTLKGNIESQPMSLFILNMSIS